MYVMCILPLSGPFFFFLLSWFGPEYRRIIPLGALKISMKDVLDHMSL